MQYKDSWRTDWTLTLLGNGLRAHLEPADHRAFWQESNEIWIRAVQAATAIQPRCSHAHRHALHLQAEGIGILMRHS